MNNDKPFFSILIPSYNRPDELERCIESVLTQSFSDFEILVSEDNSPRLEEVVCLSQKYKDRENVKFFFQEKNLREPGNKNFLINKANGNYNIIIGDDDAFTDGSLLNLRSLIDEYPDRDFYGLGYEIVTNTGGVVKVNCAPIPVDFDTLEKRRVALGCGGSPLFIFHPSTFCCKADVEKQFPYSDCVGIGEDLFFYLQLIVSEKKMIALPGVFFSWRKVGADEYSDQTNQSADQRACLLAKILMYHELISGGHLNDFFLQEIRSEKFRADFFYFEAISNQLVDFSLLHLADDDLVEELKDYQRANSPAGAMRQRRLKWAVDLYKLMGTRALVKYFYRSIIWRYAGGRSGGLRYGE